MPYLLLAVLSSALVSVIMRVSSNKVKGNVSMLAMNYMTCLVISGISAGTGTLLPPMEAAPSVLGMGVVNGILYLVSFLLLQANVKKNGVVLSSVFMKLGLLVPLAVSVFLFRERPTWMQIAGFCLAIGAILLINLQKDGAAARSGWGLVALLLTAGMADAMSKIVEQLGFAAYAASFLLFTFLTAALLSLGVVLVKKQRFGKMEVLFGVLISIPNFLSARFLLKALEYLDGVIVYPTYSVATILVVTLAGIGLFRERLRTRQWIAVGVILAALVLLNG